MARLVKMIAAGFLKIFTSHILLMFTESVSEWASGFSHILTFRVVFAVWLFTLPIIYAIYRIYNSVSVACHIA